MEAFKAKTSHMKLLECPEDIRMDANVKPDPAKHFLRGTDVHLIRPDLNFPEDSAVLKVTTSTLNPVTLLSSSGVRVSTWRRATFYPG